jgi:branched-subunit amino acid ABC-type transport system permease component
MTASPSASTEEGVKDIFARTLLCGIVLAIVLVTIALHFGLVNIGQWAYDEFAIISSYTVNAWITFSTRLLHWSPRPVSEILSEYTAVS